MDNVEKLLTAVIVVWLGLVGFAVYVLIHFILKFW